MKPKLLLLLVVYASLVSCLKGKIETPNTDGSYDPALAVNYTLSQLNAEVPPEAAPFVIDSNWTIAAIVSANDESGNYHHQLVVQDSAAGMTLKLNADNLYNTYPIGRKVYIKLKGLYLSNNQGTPELGGTPAPDRDGILQVSEIPSKSISEHLIAANKNNTLKVVELHMKDVQSARKDLCNRLIRITEAELVNPNYDNTYAETSATTSIQLQDCTGNTISLRTSNYASFQASATPWGKGKIAGIYTLYKGSGQLSIRDTTDLQMGTVRCDGSTQSASKFISIDSIRKFYKGYDTIIGNYTLKGIVTSDALHRNFGSGNIVIQDGNKGITVYFGSSATGLPDLGDSIVLNIAGAILTKYAGALEIKNSKASKCTVWSKGKSPIPITITIAELNANFTNYESVLIKILNAKIAKAGNFSGSNTLSDATGNVILFTNSTATFATDAVPTISKTYQGIATPYNSTYELKIRNPAIDIY
ncbi:MAG: DUF5689 domain-containing protein [Phycisphaerales bacterium]|nr:DUF5689 domain-containing protein [Phycisphaerales bacterium]